MSGRVGGAVLVVDDDDDSAEILVGSLEARGCEAVRAGNVSDALRHLESRPVGYVLVDYAMPGEDGLGLLARLAASDTWRSIPVTMISGHDATGAIAKKARSLGARFVPKPVDVATLVQSVKRAVERGQSDPSALRAQELAERAALRASAVAGAVRARTGTGPLLGGVAVLLVERDQEESRRLAFALARHGARVRTVATLDDASAIVSVEQVDAIACGLDERDGPAVADHLRRMCTAASRRIPSVLLSDRPPGDPRWDEHVSRAAPARALAERIATLVGRATTRRLPQLP